MAIEECKVITDRNGMETTEHGTLGFPIACYEDDMNQISVGWHWHQDFEFILVTAGSIIMHAGNSHFIMREGTAVFVNSGVLHSVESGAPVSILRSLVFNPRLVGMSAESVFWQKYIRPLKDYGNMSFVFLDGSCPWHHTLTQYMVESWEAIVQEKDEFENFSRYRVTSAMHILCAGMEHGRESHKISQKESVKCSRMKKMLTYIEDNYMNDLDVLSVASAAHVSESVCLRMFREITDTTPMQYVRRLRIEKAAYLLRNTALSASDIALDCGFNDISYFTRSFKALKHCTPGAYRKQ